MYTRLPYIGCEDSRVPFTDCEDSRVPFPGCLIDLYDHMGYLKIGCPIGTIHVLLGYVYNTITPSME